MEIGSSIQKLRDEKGSFASYVAETRFSSGEEDAKVDYLCTRGKCRYTVRGNSVYARKEPQKKASRHTSQVLNKYIEPLDVMDQRLELLLEKARLHDEAIKAQSANKAKRLLH